MQDVKSRHGATLELCLTTNMAAKGICQQEELASFIAILASGKPEDLDAYCGKDKVIRIYNNFRHLYLAPVRQSCHPKRLLPIIQ